MEAITAFMVIKRDYMSYFDFNLYRGDTNINAHFTKSHRFSVVLLYQIWFDNELLFIT